MQYYFWHLKNLELDKGKLKGRQSSVLSNARDQILFTNINPESFFSFFFFFFWIIAVIPDFHQASRSRGLI